MWIRERYFNALKISPHNVFVRYEYSNYMLNLGDTSKAIEQLKKAVYDEPNYLSAYVLLEKLTNDNELKKKFKSQVEMIINNKTELVRKSKNEYEKMLIKD